MKNVIAAKSWISEIIVVLLLLLAMGRPAAQSRVLVLEGGTLIDGTGTAPVADAVVVVTGNRITAVGRRGQVAVPPNANVIQLDGRTILPGLIDGHTHLIDWNFPLFLPYGVTTIADLHNDTAWGLAQREALKTGLIKGPRLLISGARMVGPLGPGIDGYFVKDVPEAVAYARTLKKVGVDVLKVNDDMTDAQVKAVIDEGQVLGLPVLGHTQNIERAAEMGFKHEEHMYTMAHALLAEEGKDWRGVTNPEAKVNPKLFPKLITYMVKQGVFVNPTMMQWASCTERWRDRIAVVQQLVKDPNLAFVPAGYKETWLRDPGPRNPGCANVAEFLKEYSAAGGKVLAATDAGGATIPGLSMHYEMQMLTDVGIPPMKALQGATLWAAEVLGKDKDLGSIVPGKLADFTIIEGNPLTDIGVTKNVRMVIKDGQVMDTSYDPKWVNPITFCGPCHKGWKGASLFPPPEPGENPSPSRRGGGPAAPVTK
jgi:imidazolonepropionase-like amidohydrolase